MIETERTLIRYFKENDYEALYNYLSLEEIYEFEPGAPISMDDAKSIVKERSQKKNFSFLYLQNMGRASSEY